MLNMNTFSSTDIISRDTSFLAHRIRISEILPWDRKSYLTQAVTRGLCIGCIWSLPYGRQVTSLLFKWRHHGILLLRYSETSGSFLNIKCGILRWARKRIHYLCEGRIEKSIPQDHHLASLGKPCDAKRRSSGRIFISHPYTHDGFL